MVRTAGSQFLAHYLPKVVDGSGFSGPEVLHGTAAIKERVRRIAVGIAVSHHLSEIVDGSGDTGGLGWKRAEALQGTAAEQEGL